MPTHNLEDKHTQEPWSSRNAEIIATRFSECVAIVQFPGYSEKEEAEAMANVRRIVACVNACAGQSLLGTLGFSTEELESIARIGGLHSQLDAVRRERDLAEQQRDELLAALKRIMNAHNSGNNGAYMGEATVCQAFAIQANEAIAKAEPA